MEEEKLYPLRFDPNLVNNYLKVVSNIYYLNMGKLQRAFLKEYVEVCSCFRDDRDVYITLHSLYNRFLKETRKEVCSFFNITDTEDLSLKTMLRLYYFYLPRKCYTRISMDIINFQVNYILDRISIGYEFPILIEEDHPLNYKGPINVVFH